MFLQSSYYFAPTPKIRTQPMTPLTALFLTSFIIFMLTLLVGLWAAYDLGEALLRFSLLVSGLAMMVGLAWVGRSHPRSVLSWGGIGCAFGATALGLAYGLRFTHNSGAVASGLMLLLPLALPGIWWRRASRSWLLKGAAVGAVVVGPAALLLTFERTAWIGLGIGLAGAGYLAWRLQPLATARPAGVRFIDGVVGLTIVSVLAIYGLLLVTPAWDGLIATLVMGDALVERLALWRESLALTAEYYFTGSGLGMTAMIYSTYTISMHTPYWHHAHNLYLQVALEQGTPGLLAFLGMMCALMGMLIAVYRKSGPSTRCFCLAAATALLAALGYGLLDAELYADQIVVLLFMPAGFILALYWATPTQPQASTAAPIAHLSSSRVGGAGLLPIIALLVLCLEPGTVETFYTNLAVLTQTKAELSRYHWPIWPIQDALRRKEAVDLSEAEFYYQRVLTINTDNPTVHQRLGQIALSKGEYAVALAHLTRAYQMAPMRNSLCRLLAEAYAVTGNIDQAAALWQSVHVQEAEVEDRLWWYGYLKAEREVNGIQQALAKVKF